MKASHLAAMMLPLLALGPGCGGTADVVQSTPARITLGPDPFSVNPHLGKAAQSPLVQERCAKTSKDTKELMAPADMIGWILDPLVKMFVDAVDAQIKAELEKYTEVHQASFVLQDFYGGNARTPRAPCFYLKREALAQKGGRGAMEFVGLIERDKGARALRVKPLYVGYPNQPAAELGPDGKLGLSISLKMDAFWLADEQGVSGTRFEVPVLQERIAFDPGKAFEKEYRGHEGVLVPMLPWAGGNSTAVYTVTVSEAGNPPQVLKWLSQVVTNNKDKVASQLIDAAKAGL